MLKSEYREALYEYLDLERDDEKSKHTLMHYEHVLREFINFMPNEFNKSDIIRYKQILLEKYKPKTVNNYIVIINKYIKFMEIKDDPGFSMLSLKKYYSKNCLKNIHIQVKASIDDVLEPIEFKRLLRIAKKTGQMDIYYIMKIFGYTGIRAEELKYFTVESLNSNYILVSNKGKIRNVILRQDLRKELKKYCRSMGIKSGYLFPGKKEGTVIHPSTVYKRMKRIGGKCRGISLKKIHPHSFRHLFAVNFINEGGSLSELMDILGHSSIQTTTIYTRTTDAMKRKKIERMRY